MKAAGSTTGPASVRRAVSTKAFRMSPGRTFGST